ncbi:SusC/RagA family TonB-linked outer membrane protein [Niabella beijingensis]|uniref:SusC/RagA family TonB-linked outer membrane protein n=1 Tax=Niabella beijingensis TaxID=2872700 RepID=UPI001CBDB3A1|nr:SusC/RagA family TonB-linked outer membrane protein [Niabella beijingensis]MBZ4189321.1 SusC/RagA family TonB-linked outer membrane protein [Niabella beijingensis]
MKKITTLVVAAVLCMYLNTVFSQNNTALTVSGTIRNTAGEPLSGASVTNTRTGKGTVTNASGAFTINEVREKDKLRISYIGYAAQTVTANKDNPLNIVLKDATNELDKVVVQAYGTTSQRLATGNIGVVRSEDIAKQPVMNPLQALQGMVPGVVVTNTSGYANGPVKIEIRGRNSINDKFTSDPLYVIDGVPLTILDLMQQDSYQYGSKGAIQSGIQSPANGQSPFFNINPQDIESVEILKDADATALYGSRGANGVILITTKKGKNGKTDVDVKLTTGYSQVPRFNKMLNTEQYLAMRREALSNDGLAVNINTAPDLTEWDTTRYTDWQKYLWGGNGKTIDAELSVSGGNAFTSFRVGANYHYQADITASTGSYKRAGLSANINHSSVNNRFKLSLTSLFSKTLSDMRFLPSVLTIPPNAPDVYNKEGKLNFIGWRPLANLYNFGTILRPYNSNTYILNNGLQLSYQLVQGLTLKANLGYSNGRTDQFTQVPIASQNPDANPTGNANLGNSFFENYIIEPQVEYSRFIGSGKLTALVGGSLQTNNTKSNVLSGYGYVKDGTMDNIGTAPSIYASNTEVQYKYVAAFGRLNYILKNRYIFNFNFRRDGSSRFGPGHRFGNFGSAGGAWIFTDEKWMHTGMPFISYGKLRGSYGLTGSDPSYDNQYLSRWTYANALYNNIQPLLPNNHTDSTLHWQVNKKTEIALDLGFLKDAISFSASWYSNRCDNQIVPFPTPAFTGFTSVTSNSPANVRNTGWEFMLKGNIINKKLMQWASSFQIGINRNKLIAYPNLSQSPYASLYVVGQSLNIVKVLHNTGVDPQTGLYTFEDKTGDGKITIDYRGKTADDRYIIDLSPKFDGSFINNLNFRNWNINLTFYFRKQRQLNDLFSLKAAGGISNQLTDVLKRWQTPGDITTVARFTTNPGSDISYSNFGSSDAVYSDASFIRLQNLSLSYTLPEKLFNGKGIKNCSVFIQGQNLFLLTRYKGIDPEIPGFGNMPMLRVVNLGISAKF